jgi:peptidoglycan/LPS O-acetylase OafA/YrhL
MTLLAHYLPAVGVTHVPYLWYGVDVFFGISGFLITSILLNTRSKASNNIYEIKNFFVRRVLRLFPAYYLLIIVFWFLRNFLNLYLWNNQFNPYFFSYTPNLFFYFHPDQASGSFNHLWSLGVEEQFYLVWPWVIMFMPLKWMKYFFLLLIAAAITVNHVFFDSETVRNLPISNFHTLGIGALLAYFYCCEPESKILGGWRKLKQAVLFLSFFGLLIFLFFSPLSAQLSTVPINIFLCILIAALILNAVDGFKGGLGLVSRNKFVQHIGQLSYGIYLYHMPIPDTIKAAFHFGGVSINFSQHPIFWFVIFMLSVYILARLSYTFFEIYFLKLKERF